MCVYIVSVFGFIINVLLVGIIAAISVFYVSYNYPRYNVGILLTAAYILPILVRVFHLYEIPYVVVSEALMLLMIFTLILNGRISGWRSTPGILLIIWLAWYMVELFNPAATSRLAGMLTIRSALLNMCGFFVMYSSVQSKREAFSFFKAWIVLSMLAAIYGIYQEFAGLPAHDDAWANANEAIFNLLFTWGRLRKFSFFFSPTEFGLLMAYAGVTCFVFLFFKRFSQQQKVFIAILMVILFWAMIYSGTRTASVMLPIGLIIFAIISLNRKVLITVAGLSVVGVLIALKSTRSAALFVMLSAFSSDDASMNVRLTNQQIIQSYIQEKPFGFGLGSTGALGRKYSPQTFISTFPPDSEYVKIAIETGWLGLLLWCSILAIVFGYGVRAYFRTPDRDWKDLLMALLCILFMIIVTQYPQEFVPSLFLLLSFVIGLIAKISKLSALGIKNSPALQDSLEEF